MAKIYIIIQLTQRGSLYVYTGMLWEYQDMRLIEIAEMPQSVLNIDVCMCIPVILQLNESITCVVTHAPYAGENVYLYSTVIYVTSIFKIILQVPHTCFYISTRRSR